jgi:hypothetical protein
MITIGLRARSLKKLERDFLDSALRFYLNLLIPNIVNLDIEVVLKKTLSKKEAAAAFIYAIGGRSPYKDFLIELDSNMSFGAMLQSLAHESVHLAQYASGQLKPTSDINVQLWLGKKVKLDSLAYWDLPWEIDAAGREKGMFVRWLEHEGIMDKYEWATWS